MQVKDWTYEEFPEYHTDLKDVRYVNTTGDEVYVTYIPDVEYANMNGNSLKLQILVPRTRNHPDDLRYPMFLFVQGSAWHKQNVYFGIPQLSKIAERGYVTAIIQYRGSDVDQFPAPIIDARNAVRFMKVHADEYHADPEKIILAGCSSGGHTAVYASFFDEPDDSQFPDVNADVNGVVDYYGSVSVMAADSNPTTVNHCEPDSPEGLEMGHVNLNEHPELKQKLSVECNIHEDTNIPPVLILHGTKDRTVNTSGSTVLYETLKKNGKEAEYVLIRGADHGGGEFWSEEVNAIVDQFAQKVFHS